MSLPETEEHIDALWDLLRLVRRGRSWVVALPLVDAVEEVRRWTEDDRQWNHAHHKSWQSVLRDLRRSLSAHGNGVLKQLADPDAELDELRRIEIASGDQTIRAEPALRLRIGKALDALQERLTTPLALQAAWMEVRHVADVPQLGPEAAERLLGLIRWAGHDPQRICQALENRLDGSYQDSPQESPARRLAHAAALLNDPPARSDVVVWLRALYAPVRESPTIAVGDHIRIYDAAWLRTALLEPALHETIPPEHAIQTDRELETLAARHFRPTAADGIEQKDYPTDDDIAVACVRIELVDVVVDQAPAIARRAADALICLGILNGGSPKTWQLEETFVTYRNGRPGQATWSAPPTALGVFDHMRANQDPTEATIRQHANELAAVLPHLDEPQRSAIDLLRWLRSAKAAPPAARLILCDRAIESVSGWAGVATPRRFVDQYLIPVWARRRIANEFFTIAMDVMFNDERRFYPETHPEHLAWREIINHPEINMNQQVVSFNLAGLLRHWDWFLHRLPANGQASRRVQEVSQAATDGKAMHAWFERLMKDGGQFEARRARTRNALMHGGPASDDVIEAALPFAERVAMEAVALGFRGSLSDRNIPETFRQSDVAIRRVLNRLKNGTPPHQGLFDN